MRQNVPVFSDSDSSKRSLPDRLPFRAASLGSVDYQLQRDLARDASLIDTFVRDVELGVLQLPTLSLGTIAVAAFVLRYPQLCRKLGVLAAAEYSGAHGAFLELLRELDPRPESELSSKPERVEVEGVPAEHRFWHALAFEAFGTDAVEEIER